MKSKILFHLSGMQRQQFVSSETIAGMIGCDVMELQVPIQELVECDWILVERNKYLQINPERLALLFHDEMNPSA